MPSDYKSYVDRKKKEGKKPLSEKDWERRTGSKPDKDEEEEPAPEADVAEVEEPEPEKEEPKAKSKGHKPSELKIPAGGVISSKEERAITRAIKSVNTLLRFVGADPEITSALRTVRVAIASLNRGDEVALDDIAHTAKQAIESLRKKAKGLGIPEFALGAFDELESAVDEFEAEIKKRLG